MTAIELPDRVMVKIPIVFRKTCGIVLFAFPFPTPSLPEVWLICRKNQLLLLFLIIVSASAPNADAGSTKALLLFGDTDHKTFLGCLNCVETSNASICNSLGKYGSELATDSIWNDLGRFGSELSQVSPWNSLSNNAPIIVDPDGYSYGYFSTNTLHHDRTRIQWLLAVLDYYEKTNDLQTTRARMCGG